MTDESKRFITRWDLDKTYLRTSFDSLSDLLNTALESVEDKRTVPGATAVLRELGEAGGTIHIVSGSPRQMRKRLTQKLELDRVVFRELTLKPNLSNLLRLRFGALRDQLGYKLPELLEAHARETRDAAGPALPEVLVGDDSESDAFIYSLYADLCAGKIDSSELSEVLRVGKVREHSARRCLRALQELKRADNVAVILIHLDGQSPPSLFRPYGPRVVPFFNYLQAAFVLLERGFLSARQVVAIAYDFHAHHGFTADVMARSYADLYRRGHADGSAPARLLPALGGFHSPRVTEATSVSTPSPSEASEEEAPPLSLNSALWEAVREMQQHTAPGPLLASNASKDGPPKLEPKLDYRVLAENHRGGQNRRKPGQRFR
ncbi:MAG TPA: hypothetical protein VFQ61_14490 [Polyangiaceae bacterium]|nr:hypothetical protein [Polyangiaceae bacterium]